MITTLHTGDIVNQNTELTKADEEGYTREDQIWLHKSHKLAALNNKVKELDKTIPSDILQFVERARDKVAGSWLNALPSEKQGFDLSKAEFRDALRLRYTLPISDIPTYCAC